MGEVSVDAEQIVAKLRSQRLESGGGPVGWTPRHSFNPLLHAVGVQPIGENEHLRYLHQHWEVSTTIQVPEGTGLRPALRRLAYRAVMATLKPYIAEVQEYIIENTRAIDAVTRRADELSETIEELRQHLLDLSHEVDEQAGA
jgi:hypothetical protein